MSAELEKVSRLQDIEIESLDLEGWADLSLEEKIERILESGNRELSADDFLILFQEADDEQKEEIAASLVAEGISFVETPDEDEPKRTYKENLATSSPVYLKGMLEPDNDTDQNIKEGDIVGLHFQEVGKVPLLSAEQEVELAKRIERGREAQKELVKKPIRKHELQQIIDGQAAEDHLFLANTRLVAKFARNYMGRGVPYEDLIHEGYIGLIRAIKKFDYRKGNRFSTYATWWIRQSVGRAVADHSRIIRVPVHAHDTIVKIGRTGQRLEQKLGRWPTPEEIAETLDIPVEKVEELIKANRPPLSLEEPVGEEEDSELGDFIEDEDSPSPVEAADESLFREQLRSVLHTLPPRHARILRLRYGLENGKSYTLEEIGRKMGVTRERVRQIQARAEERIRTVYKSRLKLTGYLRE